ncbi:MAG: hypothetical protein HMLKMBBP_01024 [Planctomycetes bacterium]|nr:hypothetical protein [Planctomycetota bacterium]
MTRAIGIDIGSRACKVAVVDGGPKGARLLRFAEVEYPLATSGAAAPESVLEGIRKALHDARGPKHSAGFAMPAEQLIVRELTVPFADEDRVRATLRFEFEPHLHNCAIEDVVIDAITTGTVTLGPGKQGTRLLVLAAMKDTLRARLDQLKQVGIDPLHVDVDVASLFNVAAQSGALAKHPNCLVIDIGAKTTKALAIRDGKLRVARSIRLGSKGAQNALERQFQGDSAAAKRALEDASGAGSLSQMPADGPATVEIVSSVREIEAAVARAVSDDFLGRVLRETSRTLPSSGSGDGITCVFLTGGGARHAHARERIADHFGVPVEDLDVLGAVAHALSPSEAEQAASMGAVAIGAALKVVGVDHAGVDLRKEEFRFSRTFDRVKVAVAAAATLLFFGVFLYGLKSWLEWKQVQREGKAVLAAMDDAIGPVAEKYTTKVPGAHRQPESAADVKTAFTQRRDYLKKARSHLQDELGLATSVPPIRSSLEPWNAVAAALKELRGKIEYILVKSEKYDQRQGDVVVWLNDQAEGDKILAELVKRKPDLFRDVQMRAPKLAEDKVHYELTFHMEMQEIERESGEDDAPKEPAK